MDADIRLAGLIGHPVAHSISPDFQQAAFDALGIAVRYERWDTPRDALAARLQALRDPRMVGANVTVPHKEAVLPALDAIDPPAARAGAVNTIVNEAGRLTGANTDIAGFGRALRDTGGFDARGRRAIVLGAGGAARAIVIALEQEGAASVAIANRHADRATRLIRDLRAEGGPALEALAWETATSAAALRETDLLINCTSLGLAGTALAGASPLRPGVIGPHLFVFDVVANPLITPLLRMAREAGARWLGGMPMLVYVGAASFERWTGRAAPVEIMMRAAEAAMERAAGAGK